MGVRFTVVVVFLLGWFSCDVAGQDGPVFPLPTATVQSIRHTVHPGIEEHPDSTTLLLYQGRTLSELLANRTGAYLKHYGPGSIATISLRGSSASQTALLWNGIPVQSPMLGLSDLSLFPLWLIDDFKILQGGMGPSWGSGAMAGCIQIGTAFSDQTGLQVSALAEAGSFGWSQQGISIRHGRGALRSTTKAVRLSARNAFPYTLATDPEPRVQSNANLAQWGVVQRLDYMPNEQETISLHLWIHESDRSIPPLTTQSVSEATQRDLAVRTLARWSRSGNRWQWNLSAGWLSDHIKYTDPIAKVDAPSSFATILGEAEGQYALSPLSIVSFGIQQQWITARADGYADSRHQQRSSAFAFLQATLGNVSLKGGIRQEWVDGDPAFLAPGLTTSWSPADWLDLVFSANRTYRLPTLNDLFWEPGGNPDLLPEHGWSQEFTAHLTPCNKWTFDFSGFHRNVRDWILWTPIGNNSLWTAANIAKVRSRGATLRIKHSTSLSRWNFAFESGVDYTRSTNTVALTLPRIDAGAQLFYTPQWRFVSSLTVSKRSWLVNYEHQYTGSVTAFFGDLPGFGLGNLHIRHRLKDNKFEGSLWFRLDNIWNQSYMIIERRPMPGRHFKLGITLQITSRKDEQHR